MNSYFPHDSNARNSDKLIPLRARLGAEGYGIYFMLIERLREEPSYMSVKDYNMLAFDLRVDSGKVKSVIEEFGLFAFTDDGKCFYSESLMRRMKIKDVKSEKARQSAKSRWNKSERTANALKNECERTANALNNDAIKEKKSKEKRDDKSSLKKSECADCGSDFFEECCRYYLAPERKSYQERISMRYHVEDLKSAFREFKGILIEENILEEVKTEQDFVRLFKYKYLEKLGKNGNNNRLNSPPGRSAKGYTEPDCGLHEGRRE